MNHNKKNKNEAFTDQQDRQATESRKTSKESGANEEKNRCSFFRDECMPGTFEAWLLKT